MRCLRLSQNQNVNSTIFCSLFSCGGGADLGAIAAGMSHGWGLEIDPNVAAVYRENIGTCHAMDIREAAPAEFGGMDFLHASPVCKSFSGANKNKGELQADVDAAIAVTRFLRHHRPKFFTLENVLAYRVSESFRTITATLCDLGYWLDWEPLDAADFGVPQKRIRLILRASRDTVLPPLPPPTRRVGWYEAIADLIHDLPDSHLADWQQKVFVDPGDRPLLVENTGARSDRPLQTRLAHEPCWTLRAMGHGGHYHRANALLQGGQVKALDIRCLARLQSFPDSYRFTGKKSFDGSIIGNSVPPKMYQAIALSLSKIGGCPWPRSFVQQKSRNSDR